MITLYKEYSIGIKKLSDAELDRESSASGQTHIGLSEKIFTFLPNTPTQIDGVLVFNKLCTLVECAFSKIGNKRSTKIDSQTSNPVKSVVKQIRNIAANPDVNWYLVWFAFENQMPVFWLFNSSSDDYFDLQDLLEDNNSLKVYKASSDEFFLLLNQIRKIKKLFSLVESKYNLESENRLIASSSEHRTFVHLSLDYFRSLGMLDKMTPFFNTKTQNSPITVSNGDNYRLVNMFMFADKDEIEIRNSGSRRWYRDAFMVEGRELYLYVDWYPGTDTKGNALQLMIPDFAKFVKECFGIKYVYRNAQGTHELWEINDPDSFEKISSVSENIVITIKEPDSAPVDFVNTAQQIIHYGAPGTGKSHTIDKKVTKDNSIRTTFHPDSDYSTFVGAYKPKMEDEKIVYKFQPQAFLKAYCKAWKNSGTSICLVIEEINRGNCAQIFGDLFQLLDRCKNGFSAYAIEPDSDITDFLTTDKEYALTCLNFTKDITNDNGKVIATAESIKTGQKLVLPPNLSILCTLNSSDQSLFPMDSAFKRRWQWKYEPIKYGNTAWKVMLKDGSSVNWVDLQTRLNDLIYDATESEDKMLGDWFVKDVNNEIDEETLVGKIVFYLWNDVAKVDAGKLFDLNMKELNGKDRKVIFSDFYDIEGNSKTDVVKAWLGSIEIKLANKAAELNPDGSVKDMTASRPEYDTILRGLEKKCLAEDIKYRFFQPTKENSIDISIGDYPFNKALVKVSLDSTGTPNADVKLWIESASSKENAAIAVETRNKLRDQGADEFFESLVTAEYLSQEEIAKDAPDTDNKVRGWRLRYSNFDFSDAKVEENVDWLFDIATRIRERFANAL